MNEGDQIVGLKLVEMEKNLDRSFCCGAGGARMWMEEHGEKIAYARTDMAIAVKADKVATCCPFCMAMITDGLKDRGKEETMAALDVAEVVWQAMGVEEKK